MIRSTGSDRPEPRIRQRAKFVSNNLGEKTTEYLNMFIYKNYSEDEPFGDL